MAASVTTITTLIILLCVVNSSTSHSYNRTVSDTISRGRAIASEISSLLRRKSSLFPQERSKRATAASLVHQIQSKWGRCDVKIPSWSQPSSVSFPSLSSDGSGSKPCCKLTLTPRTQMRYVVTHYACYKSDYTYYYTNCGFLWLGRCRRSRWIRRFSSCLRWETKYYSATPPCPSSFRACCPGYYWYNNRCTRMNSLSVYRAQLNSSVYRLEQNIAAIDTRIVNLRKILQGCGSAPTVTNGGSYRWRNQCTNYGSAQYYYCNSGYTRVGSSLVRCSESGSWSSLPTCRPVSCGTPPSVSHSTRLVSGYSYNSLTNYTCNPGYDLIGSSSLRCRSCARWSFPAPTCRVKSCGSVPRMSNGALVGAGHRTTYGSTVTYRCDWPGYSMVGSSTVRCTESGSWSSLPTCKAVECGQPPNVPNSNKVVSGIEYKDTTTYSCNSGYELIGNPTIRCRYCRRWTTPTPICKVKNCGPVPAISNGAPVGAGHSTTYGSEVTYGCDWPGYNMVGSSTVRCTDSGSWSSLPTCKAVECGQPPDVPNSNKVVSGIEYKDTTTYSCNSGYDLIGNPTIQCRYCRRWATPTPMCRVKNCGPVPAISNGEPVGASHSTTYGSEVTYKCDWPGYNMVGSSTVRCSESGSWSSLPTCKAVECGQPPDVPNSNKVVSGIEYKDTTNYSCNAGYDLIGNPTIRCRYCRRWTTPTPTCIVKNCGAVPELVNGEPEGVGHSTTFGSTVTYRCNRLGYMMRGSANITCTESGEWSIMPTCKVVECAQPPVATNGKVSVSGLSYNDVATYSCEPGYDLIGNSTSQCQQTEEWTPAPVCQAKDCGPIPLVVNGTAFRASNNTTYNSTVTYKCTEQDFTMEGSATVTCTANGTWSMPPNCTEILCEEGWIKSTCGFCYKFLDQSNIWGESRVVCHNLGAELPNFNKAKGKSESLKSLRVDYEKTETSYWIGGLQEYVGSSVFKWIDNTTVTESGWSPGEPNVISMPRVQLCMSAGTTRQNLEWTESPCNDERYAICEKALRCEEGWIGSEQGVCYRFIDTNSSWEESQAMCEELGGNLATFSRDMDEAEHLRVVRSTYGKNESEYWLGAFQKNVNSSRFEWSAGDDMSDLEWLDDLPGNHTANETRCMAFGSADTHYNMREEHCAEMHYSICEKKKVSEKCFDKKASHTAYTSNLPYSLTTAQNLPN